MSHIEIPCISCYVALIAESIAPAADDLQERLCALRLDSTWRRYVRCHIIVYVKLARAGKSLRPHTLARLPAASPWSIRSISCIAIITSSTPSIDGSCQVSIASTRKHASVEREGYLPSSHPTLTSNIVREAIHVLSAAITTANLPKYASSQRSHHMDSFLVFAVTNWVWYIRTCLWETRWAISNSSKQRTGDR